MDDIIIFPNGATGEVHVLNIADEYREQRIDLNDVEFLDHIIDKDVPPLNKLSAVKAKIATLPGDRWFRNAWKKVGTSIQIDMPRAKVIQQAKIDRIKAREVKRIAEEIVIEQALGNDVTALQAEIQGVITAVANVGPNINAAGTPAILKAVWPVGLPTS